MLARYGPAVFDAMRGHARAYVERSCHRALIRAGGIRRARVSVVFAGIPDQSIALGLVRQMLFARYFATSAEADAFTAASKIPNLLRNLLGEGTLSASFVPVYSRLLERRDEAGARALAAAVLGLLLTGVSALTLVGIATAPILTTVFAPGFDPARAELTTRLTRVLFPMTALMVLSGWCLGVQNSHRRFFWSYASAALWSIAQIVLLLWWGRRGGVIVAVGVVAGVGNPGRIIAAGGRSVAGGHSPHWRGASHPHRRAEGVRDTLRNVLPVLASLGVVQISSLIDLQIASYLPRGTASNLYYANLIALLPVSLFGVVAAASLLPEFSRPGAARERCCWNGCVAAGSAFFLHRAVRRGLRVLRRPVCGTVAAHGRFGAAEQRAVYSVLAAVCGRSHQFRVRQTAGVGALCTAGLSHAASRIDVESGRVGGRCDRTRVFAASHAVGCGGRRARQRTRFVRQSRCVDPRSARASGRTIHAGDVAWHSAHHHRRRYRRTAGLAGAMGAACCTSHAWRTANTGALWHRLSCDGLGARFARGGALVEARSPGGGVSGQEQLLSSLPLPDDDWTRSALARGMPPAIAMKLPHLPDGPGVYLWKAIDGTVLYVGKAKRLRSRVRSYWSQDHETSPKTRGLWRKIHELETIVVRPRSTR
jgi:hypothetical protein